MTILFKLWNPSELNEAAVETPAEDLYTSLILPILCQYSIFLASAKKELLNKNEHLPYYL